MDASCGAGFCADPLSFEELSFTHKSACWTRLPLPAFACGERVGVRGSIRCNLDRSHQLHPYRFQHRVGSQQDIVIPESNHAKAVRCKIGGSGGISVGRIGMLPAIDLDDELCFEAAEVAEVGTNRMLAPKLGPGQLATSQAAPKQPFSIGSFSTQPARAHTRSLCSWVALHGIGISARFLCPKSWGRPARNGPLTPPSPRKAMRGEGAVAATVVDSGSCPAGRFVGKAKL